MRDFPTPLCQCHCITSACSNAVLIRHWKSVKCWLDIAASNCNATCSSGAGTPHPKVKRHHLPPDARTCTAPFVSLHRAPTLKRSCIRHSLFCRLNCFGTLQPHEWSCISHRHSNGAAFSTSFFAGGTASATPQCCIAHRRLTWSCFQHLLFCIHWHHAPVC